MKKINDDDGHVHNFDDILEVVGNNGKFQKRFRVIFNLILVFFASMPYLNIIYTIVTPDHWCNVPGREFTNMTIEEWRNFTIPSTKDAKGAISFSKCKMYNVTWNETLVRKYKETIDCQNGWQYDTSWYKRTVASQENWVCEHNLNVANSFGIAKFGEVIGTLLFGQLGDKYGRKKMFFTTIVVITIGRSALTFVHGNIYLWYVFMFVGSMASTVISMAPLIIAMEISRSEDRTYIAMLQFTACTFAMCLMPLLMWTIGDWIPFVLITTLPCTLFLFSNRFITESPRWLATKGKVKRCVAELQKIAKVNGRRVPDDVETKLRKVCAKCERVYGAMSLFSSWRLAKNAVLIVTAWIVTILVYIPLTLNVVNLRGNPFLNYVFQAIAELPAYVIGKYSCDYIGRRCTLIFAFLACSLASISTTFTTLTSYEFATIVIKFAISLAAYSNQLQLLEIYPTCVRQSGQAVGAVISHASAILGPYIVYLGTSVDSAYPYVLCGAFGLIGALSGFFLPETLDTNLPETLAEARRFGADQKYFSFNLKKRYVATNSDEA